MDKQQANDPFIGQTLLERYTVVKKLGEGSFGRIYSKNHFVCPREGI